MSIVILCPPLFAVAGLCVAFVRNLTINDLIKKFILVINKPNPGAEWTFVLWEYDAGEISWLFVVSRSLKMQKTPAWFAWHFFVSTFKIRFYYNMYLTVLCCSKAYKKNFRCGLCKNAIIIWLFVEQTDQTKYGRPLVSVEVIFIYIEYPK